MEKILIINTKYRQHGGEDTNILEEIKFLKKNYEVKYLEFNNLGKLNFSDVLSLITGSNIQSNKKVIDAINSFKPNIAYVHNTWFRANLGIFRILNKNNVKTYLKIHNYRYFCANFLLLKNHISSGTFCNMCSMKKNFGLFNKYYQNSYLKSFILIMYGKRYINLIKSTKVNLLVMTQHHKKFMMNNGFNKNSIHIYRNPVTLNKLNSYNLDSEYIVYAGRLSSDKGILELIKSWQEANVGNLVLKIIGEGNLFKSLEERNYQNIELMGELSHEETLSLIKNARGVVTATKMFEGQPRLLCEASSYGVPSLFPDFGGMGEFFPQGYELKFDQFNYLDLSKKIAIFKDKKMLENLSQEVYDFVNKELNDKKLSETFSSLLLN